jgi:hypothetical protein
VRRPRLQKRRLQRDLRFVLRVREGLQLRKELRGCLRSSNPRLRQLLELENGHGLHPQVHLGYRLVREVAGARPSLTRGAVRPALWSRRHGRAGRSGSRPSPAEAAQSSNEGQHDVKLEGAREGRERQVQEGPFGAARHPMGEAGEVPGEEVERQQADQQGKRITPQGARAPARRLPGDPRRRADPRGV